MNSVSELNMYGKLLAQPLFQGMSRSDMESIVMHTKFGFRKYAGGERIVSEGEPCSHLLFLTDGMAVAETFADDRGYAFSEDIAAPCIIQPERMFGLTQRYSHNVTATTKCNLFTIDKAETMRLSDSFIIFRMNLLNIISTKSQKAIHRAWLPQPKTLRQRIVRFVESHCVKPTGHKCLKIKMERLAAELNDRRLNVSRELNAMQDEGLVVLKRARIEIPQMERLLT